MGHHSRLAALVIDSRSDVAEAADFWGAALGHEPRPQNPDYPNYRRIGAKELSPGLLIQKIDHEARVHLDIETDNQDAEVLRLEKLGAKRIGRVRDWWIMEAPTGHRFCVVEPQGDPLTDDNSNAWS